jgi:L-glyceraldehyde 3-phosphate reductase
MEPVVIDNARYSAMPQRRCGAFGLKLPAISLGAWETFGGYRGPEIARDCIHAAFDLGIFHFDLANNYGRPPGQAESVVGPILRQLPREELIVSTKAGFLMWPGPFGQGCSRKSLLSSVDRSLQRLGLDYVDIFYAHRFDADTPLEETLGALDDIVRRGKAVYAGLSNYSGAQFNDAMEVARRHHYGPIVIEQSSYNIFNRQIEGELLPAVSRAGVGLVAFSPLAQGLLSEKYLGGIPEDSRVGQMWTPEQKGNIGDETRRKIGRLNELARARSQTLPQMAIAWILRRPEITSALIGASNPAQIRENVESLQNLNFSDAELAQIDVIAAGS